MACWEACCQLKPDRLHQLRPSHTLCALACCRKNNPQAFNNVLRRMLEAAGRGIWNADAETLDQLKGLYAEMQDELEGVTS